MSCIEIGIKERLKYKDITWMMPSVDVEAVLEKLGSSVSHRSSKIIRAFCPDHHLFVGRNSSHPNWVISPITGETFCFTEGRGSNLVWIICRLMDCGPKEAAKFLTGAESDLDDGILELAALKYRQIRLLQKEKEQKQYVRGLDVIRQGIENRYMSEMAYEFFMSPPGKMPTNIQKETVDWYGVFERTWGYYSNRVVIPFFMKEELVGFCAIDILGRENWLAQHPMKTEDDYKKVLYPSNFLSGNCLFGFDACEKGAELLVITEGARDVMKLAQEGFGNAVAILGSFMSDAQFELITELAPKKIALMFDGDSAGIDTTGRVAMKLSQLFQNDCLKLCTIPQGFDPKHLNKEAFDSVILAA